MKSPLRTENARRGMLLITVLAIVFFSLLVLLVLFWPREASRETEPSSTTRAWVLPSELKLHTRPNGKAPVVARLERGAEVTLVETRGSWAHVQASGGNEGWAERNALEGPDEHQRRLVRADEIRKLPPLDAQVEKSTSLYAGPAFYYPVVGEIGRGEKVRVYTRDHEFYAIDAGGRIAYADVDAIDLSVGGPQFRIAARSDREEEPQFAPQSPIEAPPGPPKTAPPPVEPPPETSRPLQTPGGVYGSVPPGGTPPEPVRQVQPRYPYTARRAGIEGPVILRGIVRKDGSFEQVQILRDLPLGLGDAAREAVEHWRFRPATWQGQPIDVYYTVTVNFQITQ